MISASFIEWAFSMGPFWGWVTMIQTFAVGTAAAIYAGRVWALRRDLRAEIACLREAGDIWRRRGPVAAAVRLRDLGYARALAPGCARSLRAYRDEVIEGLERDRGVAGAESICLSIATHLPMVGLLGTLAGMAQCFALLGTVDPTEFAGPASMAVGTSISAVGCALGLYLLVGLVHARDLLARREEELLALRELALRKRVRPCGEQRSADLGREQIAPADAGAGGDRNAGGDLSADAASERREAPEVVAVALDGCAPDSPGATPASPDPQPRSSRHRPLDPEIRRISAVRDPIDRSSGWMHVARGFGRRRSRLA